MIIQGSQQGFYTEYDARLVEEAVLLRLAAHVDETRFRRLRNRIYELSGDEEKEKAFDRFHADWFERLQLGRPVQAALAEQPSLLRETRFCCLVCAISSREEGADLHGTGPSPAECRGADRMVLVKVRPGTLIDSSRLGALLRHEFIHIADMLDPAFGYRPLLPVSAAGPVYDNLIRERYRVAWDTWIDGRLLRRGWAGSEVRQKRYAEFAATFSACGPEVQQRFLSFFDSDNQTHDDLLRFAQQPGGRVEKLRADKSQSRTCPLCRFPSYDLLAGDALPSETIGEITADFAQWRPDDGLCRQCADLYRARDLSRSAAAALPRM